MAQVPAYQDEIVTEMRRLQAEVERLRAKNETLLAALADTVRAFSRAVEGMPGSDDTLRRALGAASAALAE